MALCYHCGKEVDLPFRCPFCNGQYCVEHRLPENHNCINQPARTPLGRWKAKQSASEEPARIAVSREKGGDKRATEEGEFYFIKGEDYSKSSKKPILKKIIALSLIVVILGVVLYNSSSVIRLVQKLIEHLPFPAFQSKPSYNHQELVNHALSLINIDRTDHGLSNVSLSLIESAQEHAESMLEHGYLSHWDTEGYKPYMRYTLHGGEGAVAENCAWQYGSGSLDVKEVIEELEWSMMYDDAESDWGHRDNILDPFHNKVSIGVAYDDHNVYYVQDFEDDYIEWSTSMEIENDGEVALSGNFRMSQLSAESIQIFYDAHPTDLTVDQLKSSQYSGSYSQGTFVGMALPPNYESVEGITITAQTWTQTDTHFQIRFDLSEAFNANGKGVYTLCLQSDSNFYQILTTYSIWHS